LLVIFAEGELSRLGFCDGKKIRFFCKWAGNLKDGSKSRRRLGATDDAHRELYDITVDDVECTAKWNGEEKTASFSFPDDWERIEKKADDEWDYYLYKRAIAIDLDSGITIAGSLEIELIVVEIETRGRRQRKLKTEEVLVYDDSAVSVTCPATPAP